MGSGEGKIKIYRLPETLRALAFDMDLTLYSSPEYGQFQVDILIERLGKLKGLGFGEMNREIEDKRKNWQLSHNSAKPCLSEIFCDCGISIEENVAWRNELFEPEKYLCKDELLVKTLSGLSSFFTLGVITNNPVLVARKTLAVLGVEAYFSVLVGLDTCLKSKPHKEPFLKFSQLANFPAETCVSIGDRYDIDIRVPLEIGMGGILVDGVEDVYRLPELFTAGTIDLPDRKNRPIINHGFK